METKKAISTVNQHLEQLRLKQHPDKTWMGRIAKGFDFLGYHFSPKELTLSDKTVSNFLLHCARLYEQERCGLVKAASLEHYVHRWNGWYSGIIGAAPLVSED